MVSAVKLTTSVHKMLQPFTRLQHLVANLLWIDGHAALRSYPERLEAVHCLDEFTFTFLFPLRAVVRAQPGDKAIEDDHFLLR